MLRFYGATLTQLPAGASALQVLILSARVTAARRSGSVTTKTTPSPLFFSSSSNKKNTLHSFAQFRASSGSSSSSSSSLSSALPLLGSTNNNIKYANKTNSLGPAMLRVFPFQASLLRSMHASSTSHKTRSFSTSEQQKKQEGGASSTTSSSSPSPPPSSSSVLSTPGRARGSLPASQSSMLPPLAEIPKWIVSGLSKGVVMTANGTKFVLSWTFGALKTLVTDPAKAKLKTKELWVDIKHELHHYWVGSKLLVAETRTSASLVRKVGRGEALTRRERLQLRRTMGDLLRVVPFVVIVIIPFAEFALPVLLKLFPNMLPSQFEKPEYRQEVLRKSLNVRLEIHGILQEVLADQLAAASKAATGGAPTVQSLMAQLEDLRAGKTLPPETIVNLASMFRDELALENMPHGQLAALAKYSGMSPYGTDRMLRAQLSTKFKALKDDDQDLAREGLESLDKAELTDACEARGMQAVGLDAYQYREQLKGWLDLSVHKNVPMTILMLSRAFTISTSVTGKPVESAATVLQQTISTIDPRVVAEVVLAQGTTVTAAPVAAAAASTASGGAASYANAAATSSATSSAAAASVPAAATAAEKSSVLELKLESIEFQNTLIKAEAEAKASAEASSKAEAAASAKAKLLADARVDPARASAEVQQLAADAEKAASYAKEKAAIADSKKNSYLRMSASDAVRAAGGATSSSSSDNTTAAKGTSTRNGASAAAASAAAADEQRILEEVAAGASLANEHRLLLKLKEVQAQLDASNALSGASVGTATGATTAAAAATSSDATSAYLREKLGQMTADIEKELSKGRLATALSAVDTNKDGVVSEKEVMAALRNMIKGDKSEEAAAALFHRLDADKDGQVTVGELEKYLDSIATRLATENAAKKAAQEEVVPSKKV